MMESLGIIIGGLLTALAYYYFGTADFGRRPKRKTKLEYFPEQDAWFGVAKALKNSQKEKPKEPTKRKLDI